jgi:hypothetical protein
VKNHKPNKRDWIFGTDRPGAPIHFPPVVPRITGTTLEELIALYARLCTTELAALTRERSILAGQIAVIEKKAFLSPVEMRQVTLKRRQLAEFKEREETAVAQASQAARREVLNLCLIRGLREVVTRNGLIVLTTSPIMLEISHPETRKPAKVVLGTYQISFDPSRTIPGDAIQLVRRDTMSGTFAHPHYNSRPCFGTWGPTFQVWMRDHKWSMLVAGLLSYLAVYNGSSPLVKICEFLPGGRYVNANPTV